MHLLHKAAKNGNIKVVEFLIKNGANINEKDDDGWTALMCATIVKSIEIIELLLKHGADINTKTTYDNTALIFASFNGHADIVKLLIEKGADMNAKNKDGKTAYDWAEDDDEIRKLLKRTSNIVVIDGTKYKMIFEKM